MKNTLYLPDGVEDLLQPDAWRFEELRRKVLDLFQRWGFQYVEPPVLEYLDALLVASGADLDLQTLKVLDQASGRQLGIRADLTSQVIRIDTQRYGAQGVQRYCYAGPVVYALPVSAQKSRIPFKAGVEIFGVGTVAADAEVVNLMLEVARMSGIVDPVLLLGHMGIYKTLMEALVESGDLDSEDEPNLFKSIQLKSESDVERLLKPSPLSDFMRKLPMTMGNQLDVISSEMRGAPEGVDRAITELRDLLELIDISGASLRFDMAELTGYGYHNGPVYSLYHPKFGSALAQGGRYNGFAHAVNGENRPATGFDMDLRMFLREIKPVAEELLIFAPFEDKVNRDDLMAFVAKLRAEGKNVVCALSATEEAPNFCTHYLSYQSGRWTLAEFV